ncbi:MAG: ABC transporter ATP-binding protein [Acidocella sp.]|nr:ABC transporter ATP-binding protein [Acidocella sp.]
MSLSLQIEAASRRLGNRVVLRDIHLSLAQGSFMVLAGESGSGKTTALRMIAGLDRADSGRISINGEIVDDAGRIFIPAERRGLGMVFQEFALWPHLSCLENVALAVPAQTPKRNSVALDLLARMGVAAAAGRRPAQLSGGQQQRVGIARALAAQPKLLLLDEPLSSLDMETRDRLREEIRDSVRAAGVSAVLVSHDPADCWSLADYVAVLEQGVIRQQGSPRSLWEAPQTAYIARFTGALGGMVVPVVIRDGKAVLDLPGVTLVLPGPAPTTPHARLFWREDAVTPAAADTGVTAEALSADFEAGRFRVRWRVAGLPQPLTGYVPIPPPLGPMRIGIDAGKLFLFHDDGEF